MNIAVPLAFGTKQAGAARQHQVGHLIKRIFTLDQLARRMHKGRQFVHAVVNHCAWLQLGSQRQRHRGVKPDQVVVNAALAQVVGQLALQHRQMVIMKSGDSAGDMGPQHFDVGSWRQVFQKIIAVGHRLFHKNDLVMLGQPAEQLLGPLVHKVPAQM